MTWIESIIQEKQFIVRIQVREKNTFDELQRTGIFYRTHLWRERGEVVFSELG